MRPKTKSEVPIGTELSARYRISREIGRGGMAAVYEAVHIDIGKRVAVKILDPSLAKNDTVIERFHREARAAASVSSPHICDVFDVGRLEDGRPYLVLELLEGESLYDRMAREGQLRVADAVRILSQAGRGLARAHAAGIIHRDLKPENIFLHRNAEGEEIVKLVDFGLAKFHTQLVEEERLTREGAIFGTPLYMSPEQVSGQGQADHRSDLWALGCITFECLTGRPIWPVDRGMAYIFAQIVTQPIPVPSSLRPELPRAFDAWFHQALQRDPERRYQSAQQMVVDLAAALGHDTSGLVSTPAILPSFGSGSFPVIVTDSRQVAPTFEALAPTEPPPDPLFRTQPTPAPKSRSRVLWIVATSVAGALVLGTVSVLTWLSPTGEGDSATASSFMPAAASIGAAAASFEQPPAKTSASAPVSLPHWAGAIQQGQRLIAKERTPEAISLFERTTQRSDHPALLTMLDHARIASAASGPCTVIALGRPRPYDTTDPARSALAVPTESGALLLWTSDASHAFAIPMDNELQPTAAPSNLTPNGLRLAGVRLVQHPSTPALLFVEQTGDQRGPWLQFLDAQGTASGPPQQFATHPGSRSAPSAAFTPSALWMSFTDRTTASTFNVFLRRLQDGKLSEPIRVTAHGQTGDERDAAAPAIAIVGNRIVVAYVRQTKRENEILFHRPGTIDELLEGKANLTPKPDGKSDATVVTQTKLTVQTPSMACDGDTCYLGWRNQPRGAHLAALDAASGEILWRKTLASAGTDVTVATGPKGEALALWFDRGRVRAGILTRKDMGASSVLARVHGEQSAPSLTADRTKGNWLTAWTCFEGGRPEAFVARLRCHP
jgi:serine/threonine-protein kinase